MRALRGLGALVFCLAGCGNNSSPGEPPEEPPVEPETPPGARVSASMGIVGHDEATDLATDPSGSIYVTGYTNGDLDGNVNADTTSQSSRSFDAVLLQYDGAGNKQWTRQTGSDQSDFSYGVAADGNGNVYLTGVTSGALDGSTAPTNHDAFLVKYGGAGNREWARQISGTATSSADRGHRVALDAAGAAYVIGVTQGTLDGVTGFGELDAFLSKYDATGVRQWTRLIGSTTNDYGNGVATGPNGSVYATGVIGTEGVITIAGASGVVRTNEMPGGSDAFLAKFDESGALQWAMQFGSNQNNGANGVAVDDGENVYVVGSTFLGLDGNASAGEFDAVLWKFDREGNKQWTRQVGSPNRDVVNAVAVDTSGNVYATGSTSDSFDSHPHAGFDDVFIVKWDALGNKLWSQQFGARQDDRGFSVATDAFENVYLVATFAGDILLTKLDPSGSRLWE